MSRHPGGRTCLGALLLLPVTVLTATARAGWRQVTGQPMPWTTTPTEGER